MYFVNWIWYNVFLDDPNHLVTFEAISIKDLVLISTEH